MDLHHAASLLTAHAQHAFTLQQQAGVALTQGTQSDPRRLARLAHQAERAVELAVLWDAVLWEAHGTDARSLFPLADPARLVAAARTLRTLTRDGITGAYDLTCQEFSDRTPERPARHWAERLFLLHTNIVDHLPGAQTATAVLAELHTRLTEAPAGTPAALDVVTALRERLDAPTGGRPRHPAPRGRDPHPRPRTGHLPRVQPHQHRRQPHSSRRPLVDDRTIRIDDQGSANHDLRAIAASGLSGAI